MPALSRRQLLAGAGSAAFVAAFPDLALARTDRAAALADDLAESYLRLSPGSATGLGIDRGARAALKSRMEDRSFVGVAAERAWLKDALGRIDAVLPQARGETAKTLDIAQTAYATALEGYGFGYGDVAIGGWRNGPYPVAQNMGAYLDAPKFLDASHVIENAADADAYLARLSAIPAQLDGETERLRAARGMGVVAPDFILAKTLAAMRLTRGEAAGETLLVTSLRDRTRAIPGDWAPRAERIVAAEIQPALDRQIAELARHAGMAKSDAGMWARPQGDAYYAWALRAASTTRMTPDEVHDEGNRQLAELHGEMDAILKGLGYADGSVGARMLALAKDPRFTFAEGDPGRAEIMAFIRQRIDDLRPRLPGAFRTLVRGNVEVKRIAPAEEIGAPGAYGGAGSIDGTVPGRFWINLRSTDMHTRFSLPTLTYHEAIPGHVWQGEYANRLPLLRTLMGFSAYSEGWALYAEQIAGELGVYDGDQVGRLGYLASMAFRAARMVVDTGIHAKRWDRDKARAWFAEATGDTIDGVTSEIDRYCVWPGQACGYKIGHTEINRQRRKAQAALGTRFDVRDFNDLVVAGGGRPLLVVERDVDAFIASRRA